LYAVLDSIVSHEHRCKYYTPDLLFTIFFTNNQSILIGSIETRIIQSGRELGCFYYKDHLFIVKGENQDTTLFSPTTKKVNNIFSESKTGYNKKTDTWFLDVDAIQDDSYFYWYYWYKDEEFIFDTKSTYCDEK
ncbi:MAG: hypothetical protein LIO93_02165, partial [Bacteroidales bacterium]|nr:hypothetical protein [Bacteroidales bacterium]